MNRTSSLPVAFLAVAIAFGASACNDDGSSQPADVSTTEASDTTTPIETAAPSEPTDESDATDAPGSSAPAAVPTVESATEVVVGLSETDASAAAEAHGWLLRVTHRDGTDLPVTMDLRPNRVNVEITDGVVTSVLNIG